MDRLPLETQTLYAELLEQLLALEASRSLGAATGTFVTKEVRGETYYYFQHSVPGGTTKQTYVGKRSPAILRLVRRHRAERAALAPDLARVERLGSLVRQGGALTTDAPSMRVLRGLAESGVFATGAVLVGTHAFIAIGNLLGVRWDGAALRTQDVDVASPRTLDLAVTASEADLPGALERLAMGFSPIPPFDHHQPSTSFSVRGSALRVDVLTTQRGRETDPVPLPALRTAGQPLRYLDYLIEAPERAAVVNGGAVLVHVPQPARFALHKLLVAVSRPAVFQAKVAKDLAQAAQLIAALIEDRPGDLPLAWEALTSRGRRWRSTAASGLDALRRRHRDAASALDRTTKRRRR